MQKKGIIDIQDDYLDSRMPELQIEVSIPAV